MEKPLGIMCLADHMFHSKCINLEILYAYVLYIIISILEHEFFPKRGVWHYMASDIPHLRL